jgi:hypothetical protein
VIRTITVALTLVVGARHLCGEGRGGGDCKEKGVFHALLTIRRRNGPAYTESLRAEYEQRLTLRRADVETLERRSQALGVWRLAIVVIGGFIAWWNYWLLPVPVAAFIALLVIHERIARKQALAARAVDFYKRGLDRLDGRWSGAGETGQRFVDPNHPYTGDLDIFGKGSLFQLVCGARTRAGEATLASWLSQPAGEDDVRSRQAGVDELRPKLDLREDLFLLGEDVRAGLHAEALRKWGSAPPVAIRPMRP